MALTEQEKKIAWDAYCALPTNYMWQREIAVVSACETVLSARGDALRRAAQEAFDALVLILHGNDAAQDKDLKLVSWRESTGRKMVYTAADALKTALAGDERPEPPLKAGYVQQVGPLSCIRCPFKTSEHGTMVEKDAEIHKHLDEAHPGWQGEPNQVQWTRGVGYIPPIPSPVHPEAGPAEIPEPPSEDSEKWLGDKCVCKHRSSHHAGGSISRGYCQIFGCGCHKFTLPAGSQDTVAGHEDVIEQALAIFLEKSERAPFASRKDKSIDTDAMTAGAHVIMAARDAQMAARGHSGNVSNVGLPGVVGERFVGQLGRFTHRRR